MVTGRAGRVEQHGSHHAAEVAGATRPGPGQGSTPGEASRAGHLYGDGRVLRRDGSRHGKLAGNGRTGHLLLGPARRTHLSGNQLRQLPVSRKAYESGGHHLTLTAEAQYGGRIESYPNQPVVLTVQLSNAGRGAVTVDSLRLVFAPWSSRVYLALPQEALLEPKEIRQRLEGHDGLEWRFDVGLAVTAKQRSFPMRGDLPRPWLERRLRRRWGPRPLWVVAQLGDGGSVDARLSDWASKLVYLKTSAFWF